jgi:hypothetical protein
MANNCTQCIKFKGQVVLAGRMLRIPPISPYATWLKAPIKMIATRAYTFFNATRGRANAGPVFDAFRPLVCRSRSGTQISSHRDSVRNLAVERR